MSHIACIHLTLLGRVVRIVVEGGVDGLALQGVPTGPIFRQSVLDDIAAEILEEGYTIGGPNGIVVARGICSRQCNWCRGGEGGGGGVKVFKKRACKCEKKKGL